jgi:Rrf2 family protein
VNISAKSRYAVRALVELACRTAAEPERPVRVTELATRREIPTQFLEQLLAALRRAGVLQSRRGASGGYLFARPPGQVSVFDVVEALDGVPTPAACTQGECEFLAECGAASVWLEAKDAIEAVLRKTTIADLLAREERMRDRSTMYYI